MLSPLLITLREGLEAALIVGIILAYLAKTGHRRNFRPVWLGTFGAIFVSILVGGAIYFLAGSLEGAAEQIFEGFTMLLAVGVLSWMIFWMRQQSVNIKADLHSRIDSALTRNSIFGLALIAFLAVVREGIETALFLFSAEQSSGSWQLFTVGSISGLLLAVVIGYTIYRGTSRLNLKVFFNLTGLMLIVFAAGLLAHGIHELNEVGYIPAVIEHVWDTNNVIPEVSVVGRFAGTLLGYNANPSLTEVIAYVLYLTTVLALYFRSSKITRKSDRKPELLQNVSG